LVEIPAFAQNNVDKSSINTSRLPKHIAIIMDGNGRWAKQKGLIRAIGHENGTKSVRQTVEASAELGIKNLTLYAFSTENWNRPKLEVDTLMKLLVSSLKKEIKTLQDNNIKLNAIGNLESLPKKVFKELNEVIESTKDNNHMTLTLALSYGSRNEMLNAVKEISVKVKNNIISTENIDESIINEHLYTQNLPDVDLLIRTFCYGKLPMPNYILLMYFGQILQSNTCVMQLQNIKKENDDLGKQVNKF